MADPVAVPCAKNVYTKAATAVTGGSLMIVDLDPSHYIWTYKMTGQPAPVDTDFTNSTPMDNQQPFGFAAPVDLYVMPKGAAGSVSRWV